MISRQRSGVDGQSAADRNEGHDGVLSPGRLGRARELGAWRWPRPDSAWGRVCRVGGLVGLSVVAGLALFVSFPQWDWWWGAPVGVGLLAVVVRGRRVRVGVGLGTVAGLALFVPLLAWTNLNTGWVPWLLLSVLQALFVGLVGGVSAWWSPLVRRWPGLVVPLTGVVWTGQEALRGRIPFGGFPWGRLAFGQVEGPLLGFAAVAGAPGVTFLVGVAGGLLAWLAAVALPSGLPGLPVPRPVGAARWPMVARWGVAVVLLAGVGVSGLWLVPVLRPSGDRMVVAVVQGNVPRLGLDFNAQRRAVLDNHVRGTLQLADRVAAGLSPRPELVVWPENASDIDPLRDSGAADEIERAAVAVGVPILVGSVLVGDDGTLWNAGLLWVAGQEVRQRYVKRHPVPFAEYVPFRGIARMVSSQVDLVRDFGAGREVGVLAVGDRRVGDVICFEVAYDSLVRDVVVGGAGVVVVQTNNATFNEDEARQQLAMVRLRAVEHGRSAVMASTVGVSAVVAADGRVVRSAGFFQPAVLVDEVDVGRGRTWATWWGSVPEWGLTAVMVAAVLWAGWLRRRGCLAAATDG